jgi:glycosyltransferase involved in cell wall biosynthesis
MKIIWLASWYPNQIHPFEGDFIQRHARAVSLYNPVTVFYVSQLVEHNSPKENKNIERINKDVTEKIIFFNFAKTRFVFLDKIVFNWRYYNTYRKVIKDYISKHGKPDLIHVHVPMKAGMIGKWIKKRWGVPYIVSEHSSHYNEGTGDNFFAKSFFHRHNVKRIFQEASAVTNVSGIVGNTLMSLFQLPNVQTIHNTVDTYFFCYNSQPVSKFRFFHASTLSEHHKNIHGILFAVSGLMKQRQDFELIIAGPASEVLKQKVIDLGLEPFVRLIGEVTYQEVASQMQKASAFLLFSRYENFPCVIIEALCCGLPVIASDVGGISEAVDDTNGILVQSENGEQLIQAMNKMIDGYESFNRLEIAEKAKGAYSFEVIGKEIFELYARELKDKGKIFL